MIIIIMIKKIIIMITIIIIIINNHWNRICLHEEKKNTKLNRMFISLFYFTSSKYVSGGYVIVLYIYRPTIILMSASK